MKFNNSNIATSAETHVPLYQYEFIKSYLYSIYSSQLKNNRLSVIRIMARTELKESKPQPVMVSDELGEEYFRVVDPFVDATVIFFDQMYEISFRREYIGLRMLNIITILGMSDEARQPDRLIKLMKTEAVRHSSYNRSFLEVAPIHRDWSDHEDDVFVNFVDLNNDSLSEIYLPDNVMDHVNLFINTLRKYETIKRPLRYLFSGKPGTAKTKLIRAIARECEGDATFIFTNGNEPRIHSLFEFADIFSPVVLCIDDIDLMTGNRQEGNTTSRIALFLQKLDGFIRKNFFLLATTNDKKMVDMAASRPGRFDMILDVNIIQPEHYLSLIKSKTDRQDIISLFDDSLLYEFKNRKVTGAYIANLVKHLELIFQTNGTTVDAGYVWKLLNESYEGFYKEPKSVNDETGFQVG